MEKIDEEFIVFIPVNENGAIDKIALKVYEDDCHNLAPGWTWKKFKVTVQEV